MNGRPTYPELLKPCSECGGWGIVREFYKEVDWYMTKQKDNGKRYYMDAWRDRPCPKCQKLESP